jgi:hypothetical protein
MDRPVIFSQEVPRSYDFLWGLKDALIASSWLQQDIAGTNIPLISGFAALASSPTSLAINLAQGRIYQLAPVDATSFGALPSDSTLVMQQGNGAAQSVLLTTGALSAGQSQWALVQANFSQADNIPADDPNGGIPYFWNVNNPTQPLQGQGGLGQTIATRRQGIASISVLYGTPATTGSEVPPTPSIGAVPLYLIDLTFGQSQIAQNQILISAPSVGTGVPSNYPYAPFLAGLLNQHHLGNGRPGQAPRIDLTAEVKNTLPLANMPASDTSGGGLPVMKLFAGNPNGHVAGNNGVNGALTFAYDTVNLILYCCTVTGTTSTAVWTAVGSTSTSIFAGGTATGTVNAQVIASTTPAGFARTPGQVVTLIGLNNTTATTLNVDSTGVAAVNKNTGSGNIPLTGGEMNGFVSVIWTGTVYLISSQILGTLATLNIGLWLKNDGAGNLTINNGLTLGDDGNGALTVQPGTITPAMLDASAAKQRGYVNNNFSQPGAGNLGLVNDSGNPTRDVDVFPGRVSDDSDITLIQLQSAPSGVLIKRLDQSWAPGTNQGGCDTSTKSNNQTWHAYVIGRTGMVVTNVARTSNVASLTVASHNLGVGSTVRVLGIGQGFDGLQTVTAVTTNTFNYNNAGGNVSIVAAPATALASGFDALFSQSYPTPAMPTGYNVKQCLGSVLTNSSGNIIPFVQWGDLFLWIAPVTDLTATSPNSAYPVAVPNGVQVEAIYNAQFTLATGLACNAFIYQPGTTQPTVSSISSSNATGTNFAAAGQGRAMTNTAKQLNITALNASGFVLSTLGWRDPRRRLF